MSIQALETTFPVAIAMMDREVRQDIKHSIDTYKSKGILIYRNNDLGSPFGGEQFAIGYGPNNTITELPQDRKNRITPTIGSAWQYYLVAWAKIRDPANDPEMDQACEQAFE